ncbi:MAG: AraC family transcriptional regulator [Saprospiraceae bacterium]
MTSNFYIPTKLTGIVDLIWEQEIPFPGNYKILPSGKVELIFPLYPITKLDALKISNQDNPVNNQTCFLSGLHTKPLNMTFDKFHVFGIQMKAVAVKALFGMPLCEIKDYFVDGQLVFNSFNMLEDEIHARQNFLDRAQWVENFLFSKINETAELHMAIHLNNAIKKYLAQKQNGSPKTIETLLGYSRTQTYRIFNDWFGVSSHAHQRLVKFIQTVVTLHDTSLSLTDIGFDNGYYDQAHFIRSFHEFGDMTPGEYRKRMTSLPGQIFW